MKLNKKMLFCATLLGGAVLGVEAFTAPTINPFYQCFPDPECPAGTYSSNGECLECPDKQWSLGGKTAVCSSGKYNTEADHTQTTSGTYYLTKGKYYKVVIWGATGGGGAGACHTAGTCAEGNCGGAGGAGGHGKKYTFYLKGMNDSVTITIGKGGTAGCRDDENGHSGGNGGDTYLIYNKYKYIVTGSSAGEGHEWRGTPEPCDSYSGGRTGGWCDGRPYSKCKKDFVLYIDITGMKYYAGASDISDGCDWGFGRSGGNSVKYSCNGNTSCATAGQSGKVEFFEWKP